MNGLIGRRLGRYEVVSLLGAGGMGEVYRARDTELERDVALKVLPEAAAEDPDRLERFAREARAVARLSHPNILEIHDVGHDNGVHYAVAELLEGENLRERLKRGRLPVRKAVAIADAISRGLGAAHAQGVVHRDVKPENVLLTSDGRVKVLDFGIASLRELDGPPAGSDEAAEISTITAAGSLVGTVGYMAPEQVRGETADARSDVFALGCLLYEMLTGQRAFQRPSPGETLAAVLHDEPPPPGTLVPDIPAGIDRVVMRCLEKEPGERFQSAADVAFALRAAEGSRGHRSMKRSPAKRRLTPRLVAIVAFGAIAMVATGLASRRLILGAPALPEQKNIAVLRFKSDQPDAESRLFALGLGEFLAANLSLLEEKGRGSLWVLPASSALTQPPQSLRELARTRGVTLGVGGEVAQSGSSLRMTFRLIDTASGATLREKQIREGLANVARVQFEPLVTVAELLGEALSDADRTRLAAGATTVTGALRNYLVGLGALAAEPPELDIAADRLASATREDPLFSAGWSALAETQRRRYAESSDPTTLARGIEAAQRALDSTPQSADAQLTLARLLLDSGHSDEGLQAMEKAVSLRPESGELNLELGKVRMRLRRFPDAETALQRAIYLRPTYWIGWYYLGALHYAQGEYTAAATAWRQIIELVPRSSKGYNNLGTVEGRLGHIDTARALFQRSLEVEPENNVVAVSNLGSLLFEEARYTDAVAMLERAVALDPNSRRLWGYLGHSCRWAGEPQRAAEAFRRAVELAEPELERSPDDPELLAELAGYYGEIDRQSEGRRLLTRAAALDPSDPVVVALIAETWEDLGERERALEWVGRAFAAGVPPHRFESRPAMRELIADSRYRDLDGSGHETDHRERRSP